MQCKSVRSLRSGEPFAASQTPGDLTWLEDFLTSKSPGSFTARASPLQKCTKIYHFRVNVSETFSRAEPPCRHPYWQVYGALPPTTSPRRSGASRLARDLRFLHRSALTFPGPRKISAARRPLIQLSNANLFYWNHVAVDNTRPSIR